jgi:outer membrane receptor protein involved in Fe transport
MRKFGLLGTSALGSAAFFGFSLALAAPAYAQGGNGGTNDTQPPACPTNTTPSEGGTSATSRDNCISGEVETKSGTNVNSPTSTNDQIVVTGSRIRRPNLESNVPITSVSIEELTNRGEVNIGDALNDLPSLRSTFSQSNSVRFIGTAGVNVLDLRGLGTSRTLVLVNGRRHVTYSPGDYLVDVNTIPTDLIERVDVITGGEAAVYGSDAVAGVVNFILKKNFDGIRLRAQDGISQRGDRGIQFVSLTAGRNFAEDRGNIAINLEYIHADKLEFNQRNGLTGSATGRCQFNASSFTGPPGQPAPEPQAGNGVPDQTFFCGVRNGTISNGGTVVAGGVNSVSPGAAGFTTSCQNPALAANLATRCLFPGTPQGQPRIFRFTNNGVLVQDTPAFDFRPFGSGNIIDDPSTLVPGATLRDTGQIAPGLERMTANVLAHFDLSPAFKPFIEGKYVHIKALQEGQPSFFSTISSTLGLPNLKCTNAFVTAATLQTLQANGICLTPSTGTISLNRFNVDFGGRQEEITRQTWRVVGGVQGDFNDDWNYEVSFNYGHVKIHQIEHNDLLLSDSAGNLTGFSLAYDAVFNSSGQIVCRVNQVTVTVPGCVPINLFGSGQPSQAALDFVNTNTTVDQRATELDALAYVNGDSSQIFSFPGGPARFVIGGEWRKETAFLTESEPARSFGTFFNAFPTFTPPDLQILEGFGELELPLLKDLPFAKELSISGAARYSHYNKGGGSTGNTFARNVNGTWAPVSDIRFRANYSKSVRAPTQSDLFFPPSQNFNFLGDPCDVLNINNGTTNRPTNCAAQGIPAGFVNTPARTASTGFFNAGNPFLTEETGKSLTVGGVLTPRWIPGFSFTVDYYRIRVRNLIATLGAQTILNQCYDLPQPNQYCDLIQPRKPDFTFANPALIAAGVNFAQFKADGIDFEASYRKRFSNGVTLSVHGIATRVLKRENFTSPTNPLFGDRILSELGDPKWAANLNISFGWGPYEIRYSGNYIGKQVIGAWENYNTYQGRPPQNADLTAEVYYPAVMYHALRFNVKVNDKFTFYLGGDNIFDTQPKLFKNTFGSTGSAGGSAWDYIGRYFYGGVQVDF